MASFVAVGDVMLDLRLERGRGSHGARTSVRAGGTAANAAVWAAAAGAAARCVGRVGDDTAGLALQAALERRGVEPRLIVDPARPTGVVAVVDGELAVDRGASKALTPEDVEGRLDADALLVSGYLLLDRDGGAAGRAALSGTRAAWRGVATGARSALRPRDAELAADANALFLDEPGATAAGGSPEGALAAFGDRFRLVCVTLGAVGAVGALDGARAAAAPPAVHPGTSVGAGDAFAAGVLVSLAGGAALPEALAAGCRLGADATAARDGWPPPR